MPSFVPALSNDQATEEGFATKRTGTHTARADALRAQIEHALGSPGALTPAPRLVRETMATGIAELDATLDAGLPIGAITELVGPLSSGRTGVALSTVAAAMREGNLCAWVDASDAFDPESAAAHGVCLEQLLWVRCGVQASPGTRVPVTPAVARGPMERAGGSAPGPQARAGQHPRDEVRGLDTAVGELLRDGSGASRRDRSIGTPGAPNRNLSAATAARNEANAQQHLRASPSFGRVQREEQVSSDRQPRRARGGSSVPALAPDQAAQASKIAQRTHHGAKPWARLDQALRAIDLLLQAGGFRVLVLDLGSIAPEHALRIPQASWFRFRAAAEANRTVLLALTQSSCARSSAGLVVHFSPLQALIATTPVPTEPGKTMGTGAQRWSSAPGCSWPGHGATLGGASVVERAVEHVSNGVLESVCYQAKPVRQRFTPVAQPVAINHCAGPRPPQATWQRSAYPVRERA